MSSMEPTLQKPFVSYVKKALEEAPGWVSGRRQSYGEAAAWSNRAADVSRILSTAGFC